MGAPDRSGRLGRYEIVKHLASGGMAELLLARARGLEGFERFFAIKRILLERERDATFVEMFLAEARLAAALHHQNIVQVHDIGEENGVPYFAMEYVHGEDLRRVLATLHQAGQKMPLAHVVAIVEAIAAGLHHAHEAVGPDRKPLGVVHRDVAPANVLVGYDGGVKIVDFGIARAALRRTETASGIFAGKASYMAPEQCSGGTIDRRSDVFALGIVMFELLTTRRLFKGDSDFMTMSAVVEATVPAPSTLRPDIPPALDAIVKKALMRNPADRYQSAEEMHLALHSASNALGLRSSALALAAYMKELFGHRVEPWLGDDTRPPVVGIDFDGELPGVAELPQNALDRAQSSSTATGKPSLMNVARTAAMQPLSTASIAVAKLEAALTSGERGTVRIPDAAPGVAKQRAKTMQVPVATRTPARNRPKTVQIPTQRSDVPKVEIPIDQDISVATAVTVVEDSAEVPAVPQRSSPPRQATMSIESIPLRKPAPTPAKPPPPAPSPALEANTVAETPAALEARTVAETPASLEAKLNDDAAAALDANTVAETPASLASKVAAPARPTPPPSRPTPPPMKAAAPSRPTPPPEPSRPTPPPMKAAAPSRPTPPPMEAAALSRPTPPPAASRPTPPLMEAAAPSRPTPPPERAQPRDTEPNGKEDSAPVAAAGTKKPTAKVSPLAFSSAAITPPSSTPTGGMQPLKPTGKIPSLTKPADAKPADAKPAAAKPIDAKPADATPADAKVDQDQKPTLLDKPDPRVVKDAAIASDAKKLGEATLLEPAPDDDDPVIDPPQPKPGEPNAAQWTKPSSTAPASAPTTAPAKKTATPPVGARVTPLSKEAQAGDVSGGTLAGETTTVASDLEPDSLWNNPNAFEPDEPSVIVRSRSLLMAAVAEEEAMRAREAEDASRSFADNTAIDDPPATGFTPPPPFDGYAAKAGTLGTHGSSGSFAPPLRGSQDRITPLPPPPMGPQPMAPPSMGPPMGPPPMGPPPMGPPIASSGWPVHRVDSDPTPLPAHGGPHAQPPWAAAAPTVGSASLPPRTKKIIAGALGIVLFSVIIAAATSGGDEPAKKVVTEESATPPVPSPAPAPEPSFDPARESNIGTGTPATFETASGSDKTVDKPDRAAPANEVATTPTDTSAVDAHETTKVMATDTTGAPTTTSTTKTAPSTTSTTTATPATKATARITKTSKPAAKTTGTKTTKTTTAKTTTAKTTATKAPAKTAKTTAAKSTAKASPKTTAKTAPKTTKATTKTTAKTTTKKGGWDSNSLFPKKK